VASVSSVTWRIAAWARLSCSRSETIRRAGDELAEGGEALIRPPVRLALRPSRNGGGSPPFAGRPTRTATQSGCFTFYGPRVPSPVVLARLGELAARYDLNSDAASRLATLLDLVATEPASITSIRDSERGVDVHVADSLVALEIDAVRDATNLADLGSGGGFPGLVLAIALPEARVALVESVGRKCAFLERAADALGLPNATVVNARAESWPEGLGVHDVVTARALAPLGVLVEYAAPLLGEGGSLVAWKGRLDADEEADAGVVADALGMTQPARRAVAPFVGADARTLYLSLKVRPTPSGYPRRSGMARKRPFRASS
jgi:16S rRNA (guanine527-N7)-methyltransferase